MTSVETLVLNVTTRGMTGTLSAVGALDTGIGRLVKRTIGIAALTSGIALLGKELVNATAKYGDYIAALQVSTGSQEEALKAYEALSDFAYRTPYDIDDVTKSFIKLTNFGLEPSQRALTAYGNIAASTIGKTLDDVVMAVERAVMNDMRRLKAFGIGAKQAGDYITFQFQGVSTKVKKNVKDIEQYIMNIGETTFAGAMDLKMARLSGAMSNFRDSWFRLMTAIQLWNGTGDAITQTFLNVTAAVENFKDSIQSGQLETLASAQRIAWSGMEQQAKESLGTMQTLIRSATIEWGALFGMVDNDIDNVIKHWPIYLSSSLKTMTSELASWAVNAKSTLVTTLKVNKSEWKETFGLAKLFATDILTGGKNHDTLAAEARLIVKAQEDARRSALQQHSFEKGLIKEQTRLELLAIDEETAATTEAFDKKMEEARLMREEYDLVNAIRKKQNAETDPLAKYNRGNDGHALLEDPEKAKKPARARRDRGFEQELRDLETGMVVKQNAVEEKVIADSYEARKRTILDDAATTEEEKKHLILTALSQSLMTETDAVKQAYVDRARFILSDTQATEEEKSALIIRITEARNAQLKEIDRRVMAERLDAASTFFGNLASVGSAFGRKGFEISKAAAIAETTIKSYQAATSAYASLAGIPYIGPALGAAAAAAAIVAGAANIAKIKSQSYAGAFEHGGMIPAGKYGLVGEAGPEIVRGPAIVTSAAATRGTNTSSPASVTVHNYGAPVDVTTEQSDGNLLLVLKPLLDENRRRTKKEIAGEITRGGGGVASSLERTYGLPRRPSA